MTASPRWGDSRAALKLSCSDRKLRGGQHSASGYVRDISATSQPLACHRWAKAHQAEGVAQGGPGIALNAFADVDVSSVATAASPPEAVVKAAASAFDSAVTDVKCLALLASLHDTTTAMRLPRARAGVPGRG